MADETIDVEGLLDDDAVDALGARLRAGLREEMQRAIDAAEVLGRMRRRGGVLDTMARALGERGKDGGR